MKALRADATEAAKAEREMSRLRNTLAKTTTQGPLIRERCESLCCVFASEIKLSVPPSF